MNCLADAAQPQYVERREPSVGMKMMNPDLVRTKFRHRVYDRLLRICFLRKKARLEQRFDDDVDRSLDHAILRCPAVAAAHQLGNEHAPNRLWPVALFEQLRLKFGGIALRPSPRWPRRFHRRSPARRDCGTPAATLPTILPDCTGHDFNRWMTSEPSLRSCRLPGRMPDRGADHAPQARKASNVRPRQTRPA